MSKALDPFHEKVMYMYEDIDIVQLKQLGFKHAIVTPGSIKDTFDIYCNRSIQGKAMVDKSQVWNASQCPDQMFPYETFNVIIPG